MSWSCAAVFAEVVRQNVEETLNALLEAESGCFVPGKAL